MHYKQLIPLCMYVCILGTYTFIQGEDTMKTLVDGNTKFGFTLYQNLSTKPGNIFISPYSISTALAMVYIGSETTTKQQMEKTLCFPESKQHLMYALKNLQSELNAYKEQKLIELSVANHLWIHHNYKVVDTFLTIMQNEFSAGYDTIDFTLTEPARIKINTWVESNTNNRIKDILQPGIISKLTRLVLANAIYFKGSWEYAFEKSKTKPLPFFISPSQKSSIPFMHTQRHFDYAHVDADKVKILRIPYKGGDIAAVIVLPAQKDGLLALEKSLTPQRFEEWTNALSMTEVSVYLPPFTLDYDIDLSKTLSLLGMPNAFLENKADFSGISPKKDLYISNVIHKAFVNVNEEGTEAAAATVIAMRTYAAEPAQPVEFRADHPFLFLIVDTKRGSVLFIGRFSIPKQ